MRAEPSGRIDARALKVWRMTGGIVSLFAWLVTIGITGLTISFGWYWIFPVLAGVIALMLSICLIVIVPPVRWRRWRYEVSEREVDLKHGVIVVTRTLIPMVRVQHVDTAQGPILRRYNLATVTVSTAAGAHEIPALPVEEADELRDKIAQLAGIADDV
mgnify:CR=1 FL=1